MVTPVHAHILIHGDPGIARSTLETHTAQFISEASETQTEPVCTKMTDVPIDADEILNQLE